MSLKGVLFSLENVLYHDNHLVAKEVEEFGRLVKFLRSRGVTPAVVANRTRTLKTKGVKLQDALTRKWGDFPWFVAEEGTGGWKPKAEAVDKVLAATGWKRQEVALIGNDAEDMKTAKNGGVLFLNAEWFEEGSAYGLKFSSIRDIGRFIDLCCLKQHPWFFRIEDGDLQFYALGPYARSDSRFGTFSNDALYALKNGTSHTRFWVETLCASTYFSGVSQGLNYIAPYPGHTAGSGSAVLDDALVQVATCFGITYTRDLIQRHKTVQKAAFDRSTADHARQFNSIKLNRTPQRTLAGQQYKNNPLKRDRRVLVVDDFCTKGYSFEAARHFIGQTGASCVCVSFLKTVSRDYETLTGFRRFDPFVPQQLASVGGKRGKSYPYSSHIVDPAAPTELSNALAQYDGWSWPGGA